MRLVFDLRISQVWADKHLAPGVGKPLTQGPGFPTVTRQVVVDATDPLLDEIRKKVLASERRGESLFCFVNPDYHYDKQEIDLATLIRLRPTAQVKTYGQRCGTIYDETNACPKCGFGRLQTSPLVIDPRYLSKRKEDFLVTITADEWIVSARLARLLRDLANDDCTLEYICDLEDNKVDNWFQLKVRSVFGSTVPPTRFGLDYFHPEDRKGEYVCPEHHLSGLNLLSELHMKPEHEVPEWPALSISMDREGRKAGWIVPAPFLMGSRSLVDALLKSKIRGLGFDVAYVL